jgi:N-acetylglucosaminyl-diphospho-decaprenol L-rhamnosyltransferase
MNEHNVISVLIVNYNGIHLLRACLEAVRTHTAADTEIILHDNGSSDGSANFVQQNFPYVHLIRSSENLGFVGGNNAAAKFANGQLLLLLNSDTIMQSSIQPMVDMLKRDSRTWAVGCRLVYGDGTQQETIGRRLGPLGLAFSWSPLARWFISLRRMVPRNSPLYSASEVDCDWVSGACLMTPAARWRDFGGLDEKYFMYMEDVDYCAQIKRLGGRVCYTTDTVVTHFEGAGRPWIGRRAVLNTAFSYTVYTRKFHGLLGRALLGIFLPMVWWVRAAGYGLMYVLGRDEHGADKASAFGRAGLIVMFGQPTRTRY